MPKGRIVAKNKFNESPLETVTERIQQERFTLPPLPEMAPVEVDAAPAATQQPLVTDAPEPTKPAGKKASSSNVDFSPPEQYRSIFESAARQYNVPVNVLMALGHQESRFNPKAIGTPTEWGRAKGMMQYLDSTANSLGINPFDPNQAIGAAARQIRERLDKGYSMADAVKEHFAGPNRKQWGQKTAAYGNEVLSKAARIAEALYPFDQSPEEVARRDRQRTEIEAQELYRDGKLMPDLPKQAAAKPERVRTWGEVASDTGVQLAEGVNNIIGAVPNLVAPEGEVAEFFNRNAEYWNQKQSEPLKAKIEAANAKISEAGKDGILSQITEAASQYFTDPALAARFITTNIPSMIPGVAAAKVAQASAIARGATAAKAAAAATTAAGATNAALNAGGARGEAFNDIKQTLMSQGMSEEQAIETALKDSRVVAGVGAVTGYLSGKTGLEGALVGKAGTQGALRAGVGSAAAELAGEQAEEVLPQVATNYQAGQYDNRSLGQDVGRTIVETAIGSGPGAAVSGGVAAADARGQRQPSATQPQAEGQPQQPSYDMPPEGSAFDDTAPAMAADAAANTLEPRGATVEGEWIPAGDYLPPGSESKAPGPMTRALENTAIQQQQEAAAQTGPLTKSLGSVAAQAANDAQQAPNIAPNIALPAPGIEDQQQAIAQPAAPVVSAEQPKIEAAQPAITEPPAAKPVSLEDMTEPELRARLKYLAGQAKATGGWNKMLMDERRKVERQIGKLAAASQVQANPEPVAEKPATPEAKQAPVTAEQSKDDYTGKWFGSQDKAEAFIAKKKAGATHEAVQTGKVRWEIKPKAVSTTQETSNDAVSGPSVAVFDTTTEVQNLAPAAEIVEVKDNFGRTHRVRKDDLNGQDSRIPTVRKNGDVVSGEEIPRSIIKTEQPVTSAGQKPAKQQDAPGTRVNGDAERKAADRLEQLYDQMSTITNRNSREGNAKAAIRSMVEELRRQKTVTNVVGVLEKSSSDLMRKYGAFAQVVQEVADSLNGNQPEANPNPSESQAVKDFIEGRRDTPPTVEEVQAEAGQTEPTEPTGGKPTEYGANNKLVSRERAAELRDRLKQKLSGTQLNSGIDPELLAIGTELAVFHIEAGARKFAQFAKAIAEDLDMPVSSLRPYLRSWYNGARDMTEDMGGDVAGMDSAEVVREELGKLDAAEAAATITEEVKQNDRNADQAAPAGGAGNRALEGVPAEEVRGTESGGDAEQRGPSRGRDDAGRTGEDDRAGLPAGSGVGDGARDVSVPAGRSGGKRGGAGQSGLQAAAATEQADAGPVTEQRAAETAEARKATIAGDYRITDLTRLGEGGQKTKFRNNVAAIRLLNDLQQSGRQASAEEQDTLARYVGWGGIAQAFDPDNAEWSKEYAELKDLLTPEEWDAAKESTQYAHYTSQEIIAGMYDALKRMGFSGGKIVEPGSGVGNFIGLMPEELRSGSRFTAVERERIAGGIAKMLYPNQNVQQQDFRKFNAQDGYFDVALGNPPFSATPLTDLSGRKHLSGLSVHNYFFAKSIDMLREGGVLAMVVSNSFLDAKGDKARRYIGGRAELLGAIRLPNNAFAKNANTEVTTDIIFLRKRPESEWGGKAAKDDMKRWQNLGTVPDPAGGDAIPLNQYFIDNPQMMLGRMERAGSMYRAGKPALIARAGQDTAALMRQAISRLPENAFTPAVVKNTATMQEAEITALADDANVDVGGHYVKDGELFVRLGDVAGEGRALKITATTKISEKRELGKNGLDRLKQLADMRVTVRQLLAAEIADAPNMEELRAKLNQQYDSYVKEFGYINQRTTVQLFGDDPDFPLLASLEHGFDPGIGAASAKSQGVKAVTASAKKAPIFSRRVIEKHEEITKADTPEDALMVSIAERGKIDPAYIGSLLGRDGAAVLEELTKGDKPALFVDPATGGYVLRDAYLSGNVRKKLAQAKAAGMYGNVAELEKVIPEDIPAHEISGKIGAPWVPTEVYEQFAQEIMGEGTKARVVYVPAVSSYIASFEPGSEVANTNTFGTTRMGADELYSALLNSKEIKVGHYEEDPSTRSRRFVLEKDATDEANDKAREIKDKFNDWLFADADRAEKMQRAYNDAVNNYVTRIFDGSMLKFPGKVPDAIIKLRRHQRNAVARIIQDGTALLDHVVGAGKTFTVIAAAMELKRTGLAKKPMIVVPNHLVKQWAADFYRLYPGANILTATKKDFEKANRRKFLAKIATGNWDAVIIAHSSFGFIKPDAEFELRFNQDRIDEILGAIEQLKQESGQDSKRTVKQLAKMKEGLENKLASLRDKPMDDLLDFGQIGVDHVFVDEAHLFKNLMFVTKMQNVRGLGQPKGSQRAYDMFIKTHQIYDQSGNGRGVVFATGTPVSNSLAEMYHMLRYLAPQTLQDSGQFTFDAWAKTYADVEQVWMQALSGEGYKASNRMSRFVNTPELLRVFDQVADTVTIDDIKQAYAEENNGAEFPIPPLKGGRRAPVSIPRSQDQTDYMAEIGKRAKALEQRKGKPQKGDDNMLSIMGDARKAAMDIRMVRPEITERDPNGRIAMAARNIMERYQRYNDVRGTQLVFSDMGTPKKQAEKELKEYNELMAATAPLSDEQVLAMAELGDEAAQEALEKAEEAQRKIEAKGQDWLDAIRSAMRGFSVYDDLKDALVEMGIPDNEIAFIHDYNTDDQKAALFRAVNDGKVRVLLGSTEKMGAGTNVQERAVAMHHLDVPWKPSDIEQREGRVIRQGNKLLDQIPGFEVEVLAYATQDTLDLFMWQTQEKKLAMIGQLRTGNVGREVDNAFEEMQMSAGEMQAAATSNPSLLEEIQLKDKVKRLERQKRSFEGQKNDLANRRKKSEKALAELPAQIAAAEKVEKIAEKTLADIDAHFAGLQATVNGQTVTGANNIRNAVRDAINAAPVEEKGGKEVRQIKIEFNGKEYTSQTGLADAVNKELGDAAQIAYTLPDDETVYRSADVAANLIDPVANMLEAETDQTELGKVGAFEVTAYRISAGKIEISTSLNGDEVSSYEVRFDEAEPGALTSALRTIPKNVQQAIMSQKGNASYLNYKLESAKKTLADIESKPVSGEWDGNAELKKARDDYRAVLKKLAETGESKEEATSEEPRYSVNAEGQAVGEFGPVTEDFRDEPAGAIKWLQDNQTGEAIVNHPTLGEISLIWGDGSMGLSHIAKRRGESFLGRIADILKQKEVYEKPTQTGRVFLGNESDEATIRLDWNGQAKAWLLSAYEKHGDTKPAEGPRASTRSDVVKKRTTRLSVEDLRKAVSGGVIGKVVAMLIDNGQIVLHKNADTLPAAARGKRGVQAVTLANGQIHLVANRLNANNAMAVLLHEMFHMGGERLVGSKRWGELNGRLGSLYRQAENSNGRMGEFFARARARVEAARAQGAISTGMTVEEFGAYAIEEWEQKRDSLPAVIRKWVEDVIGHIKAYLFSRYGKQLGAVTPAQLSAMAKMAIMNAAVLAERGQLSGISGKFSVAPEQPRGQRATNAREAVEKNQDAYADAKAAQGAEFNRFAGIVDQAGRNVVKGINALRTTWGIVSDYQKAIPSIREAYDLEGRMDGRRIGIATEASKAFGRDFSEMAIKDPATADKLADLMTQATLWQIKPDKAKNDRWRQAWKDKYDELRAAWDALPQEAKDIYDATQTFYENRSKDIQNALKERIMALEIGEKQKRDMLAELQERFDRELGTGPYFPLARFGSYLVIGVKGEGDDQQRVVMNAEYAPEAEAISEELRRRGYTVSTKLAKEQKQEQDMRQASELVRKIAEMIEVQMPDFIAAPMLDELNQIFLDALPLASARKSFIHRKNVAGFSRDMARALNQSAVKLAGQIAKLEYAQKIEDAFTDADKQAEASADNFDLQPVVGEMRKRFESTMRFKTNSVAAALQKAGFAFTLAYNLSSGAVNLLQMFIATGQMGARHGYGMANKKLGKALLEISAMVKHGDKHAHWFDLRKAGSNLNDGEKKMLEVLEQSGKIDVTAAMDAYRAAHEDTKRIANSKFGRVAQKVMDNMGVFMQAAEVVNRQAVALAAYRMELQKNDGDIDAAIKYAAEVLDDTQFNMNISNQPRFMHNNAARVVMQYKGFAINMMDYLGRTMRTAMDGMDQDERRQATKALSMIFATQVALAGIGSLPLYIGATAAGAKGAKASTKALGGGVGAQRLASVIGGGVGALALSAFLNGAFGDDDEPWDWKADMRRWLAENTNATLAQFLDRGLFSIAGVDIADRISMNGLVMRDLQDQHGKKAWQNMAEEAALGMGGVALSKFYLGGARALDALEQGNTKDAMLAMLPLSLANLIKGTDLAANGMTDKRTGTKLMDVNAGEALVQMFGFQPSDVRERRWADNVAYNADRQMQDRKSRLLDGIAKSILADDSKAEDAAWEAADRWNDKNGDLYNTITKRDVNNRVRQLEDQRDMAEGEARTKGQRQQMERREIFKRGLGG